jgi:FtsH-binding integral membrane protein
MANKKGKTIEEELINRSSYVARDAITVEVTSNYNRIESEANNRTSVLQNSFREEIESMNLNLPGTVYFLLTCQLLVSFVMLLILDLFTFIMSLLLLLIILGVLIVYCVAYFMLSRFPEKFKKSSSSVFLWVVLAICEGIVLCFLSIPISPRVFLLEVALLIAALFIGFVAARVKKENFNERMALSCVLGTSVIFYVIWMVSFQDYLWLSLCTICVLAYEVYLVKEINKACVKTDKEGLKDIFTAGLFVCLVMFQSKIDLAFKVLSWLFQKVCKKRESPEAEGVQTN